MFLPATVLCCYFYIEQSRKQTLKIVTIAFCFVRMIYKAQTGSKYHSMYYSKTHATAKNEEYSKQILVDVHLQRKDVTDSQKKDKVSPLLDEQWCKEFLNTVVSINVIFMVNERKFNTEYIGSYVDEHFFAKVRMMSSNVDTYHRFIRVFDKIVLSTAIRQDISVKRSHALLQRS